MACIILLLQKYQISYGMPNHFVEIFVHVKYILVCDLLYFLRRMFFSIIVNLPDVGKILQLKLRFFNKKYLKLNLNSL